jgi:ubiquinone/menaquinone biosynthesis C-methylase UbiE
LLAVKHEAKLGRLRVGLRGLALLRDWPFGDPERADEQLDAITDLLAHRDEPPMNEALNLEGLDHDEGYAAWAATYDDPGNALLLVEEPVLRSILEDVPLGDAVDVACGTGRVTAILCDLGHHVTGIDLSEAMLDRARAKGLPATFVTGSFDPLPLADDSVDLVTCALALTHVTDLRPPVREFARILRPRGRVVLTDIHPFATATGAQAFFRRADGSRAVTTNHQHWPSDYVHAFSNAGLVVERCEEPLVDEAFTASLSDEVRGIAESALTGLPLLLIWVLRAE